MKFLASATVAAILCALALWSQPALPRPIKPSGAAQYIERSAIACTGDAVTRQGHNLRGTLLCLWAQKGTIMPKLEGQSHRSRVEELFARRGLTIGRACRRLGVTETRFRAWLRGDESILSPAQLAFLAEMLGTAADYINPATPAPTSEALPLHVVQEINATIRSAKEAIGAIYALGDRLLQVAPGEEVEYAHSIDWGLQTLSNHAAVKLHDDLQNLEACIDERKA